MDSCSDYTWTDLVQKTSTDNGKTWGNITIVHREGSKEVANTVGNACPV